MVWIFVCFPQLFNTFSRLLTVSYVYNYFCYFHHVFSGGIHMDKTIVLSLDTFVCGEACIDSTFVLVSVPPIHKRGKSGLVVVRNLQPLLGSHPMKKSQKERSWLDQRRVLREWKMNATLLKNELKRNAPSLSKKEIKNEPYLVFKKIKEKWMLSCFQKNEGKLNAVIS